MTPRSLTSLAPLVVALGLALAACTGEPAQEPTEAESTTPTPEPTVSQEPAELAFAMPADCREMLPADRQSKLEAEGRILLGGPGGKYPQYYSDPTPEEQAGGMSCIWGDEAAPESTVTVSVAPLSAGTRGGIVDNLIAQGLNEAVVEDGVSYAQIGDENSAPGVFNILRDDSWISVIEALGGESRFDEAVQLATEAASQAYRG
ncbi:MAG: hypothetical protein R2717_06940 [Schumannella sp.]